MICARERMRNIEDGRVRLDDMTPRTVQRRLVEG